jgi:threonine dehydratase/serine racemase
MIRYAIAPDDVRRAAQRIGPWAHRTPVMTCATLDRIAGRRLFFKCEQWQKSGSFKFRGAANAVLSLPDAEAARGVVTHSSGNHAQALALVARLRGIPAHIVMPTSASAIKRRAVEEYGGRVVPCAPNLAARETTTALVQGETGAVLIPPYDHADIMAGQGTAALELLDEVPDLDAVIAPVGGGGLLSGVTIAARAVRPRIRVFAAEPLGADDAARSRAAGTRIPQTAPNTIADGLLTSLGEHTWPVIRDLVEDIVTVREDEILAAMRLAWERAKLLIEPSSAVALAAVLGTTFRAAAGLDRVGVILSGGNVDLDRLPWTAAPSSANQ